MKYELCGKTMMEIASLSANIYIYLTDDGAENGAEKSNRHKKV